MIWLARICYLTSGMLAGSVAFGGWAPQLAMLVWFLALLAPVLLLCSDG